MACVSHWCIPDRVDCPKKIVSCLLFDQNVSFSLPIFMIENTVHVHVYMYVLPYINVLYIFVVHMCFF